MQEYQKPRAIALGYFDGVHLGHQALMERIESNMRRFQCWEENFRSHIVPVPGDLSQPRLGIAPEEVTKAGGASRLLEKGGSYGKA